MRKKRNKFFRSPPNGVWRLLVIDDQPIRRRALDEYRSAERRLEKIRTELEVFETNDMPAFNQWEARTFGALLTEIRETESAAAEKRRIVEAIEDEVMWSGCTQVTAYRRVMEVLNRSAAGEEEDEPSWGNKDPEGMDFEPGSDCERMFWGERPASWIRRAGFRQTAEVRQGEVPRVLRIDCRNVRDDDWASRAQP